MGRGEDHEFSLGTGVELQETVDPIELKTCVWHENLDLSVYKGTIRNRPKVEQLKCPSTAAWIIKWDLSIQWSII